MKNIIAIIGSVLFIICWRISIAKEKHEEAKKLADEADAAIVAGKFSDVVSIWSRMRTL